VFVFADGESMWLRASEIVCEAVVVGIGTVSGRVRAPVG